MKRKFAILLIALPFIFSLFVSSIHSQQFSSNNAQQQAQNLGALELQQGYASSSPLTFWIFVSAAIGFILFVLLRTRSRNYFQNDTSAASMLGYVIAIGIFLLLLLFARTIASISSPSVNLSFSYNFPINLILTIVSIIMLALALTRVRINTATFHASQVQKTAFQESKNTEEEFLRIASNLSGLNAEVVKIYAKFYTEVRKRTGTELLELTPRELAVYAKQELALPSNAVDGITKLFEKARYSSYEINENELALANNYLDVLKSSLGLKA